VKQPNFDLMHNISFKYLLVYLVKQPNFDLMHNISFFSRFVFDKFIVKGGENVHKVNWTLC
jgi:hypothetical protein